MTDLKTIECAEEVRHGVFSYKWGLEEKMQKQEDFKKKIGWTIGVVAGILVAIQYFSTIYYNVIKK